MKNLLLLTFFLATTFSVESQAQNRFNNLFRRVNTPLMELSIVGGFCRNQCPTTHITLYRRGQVKAVYSSFTPLMLNEDGTTSGGQQVQKYKILTLSPVMLKKVKKNIRNLDDNAQLQDMNPQSPQCADLPVTTYAVFKKSRNKKFVIGEERNCKSFRLDSNQGFGLIQVLKSMQMNFQFLK